ncbi:hypothetical protein FB446DRAFT_703421 [Lentinula raphanica]|nr:hypothetical protein FB446DRAFT_703421 [Lentinula raphanica]
MYSISTTSAIPWHAEGKSREIRLLSFLPFTTLLSALASTVEEAAKMLSKLNHAEDSEACKQGTEFKSQTPAKDFRRFVNIYALSSSPSNDLSWSGIIHMMVARSMLVRKFFCHFVLSSSHLPITSLDIERNLA